jgi:hypothetical protein
MSTHGYLNAARLATHASSISDVFAASAAQSRDYLPTNSLDELIARRTAAPAQLEPASAQRSA